MATKLLPINSDQQRIVSYVDESLIDTLWHELDGQVPQEQIACVVYDIALTYQDATVKAFVPILIHRQALDHFKKLLGERPLLQPTKASSNSSAPR